MAEEKIRNNNKTVELETIEEEKPVNYARNKKLFIGLTMAAILLTAYILYLVVTIFIG